jgi:hypothetical protein
VVAQFGCGSGENLPAKSLHLNKPSPDGHGLLPGLGTKENLPHY